MSYPLIGVTTTRTRSSKGVPLFSLAEAYVQALHQAGAAPILIPSDLVESALERIIERLDGVLFSGGGDLHPNRYGENDNELVKEIDEGRDLTEFQLFEETLRRELPFMGICRGLQFINVAMGGSLYADIAVQYSDSMRHDCFPEHERSYLAHSVRIEDNSRLAAVLGMHTASVNSMHHQAIRELASGLTASAWSPDGLVEGVELPGYKYGVAVQWHPEWLTDQREMRALFRSFVEAAGSTRKSALASNTV